MAKAKPILPRMNLRLRLLLKLFILSTAILSGFIAGGISENNRETSKTLLSIANWIKRGEEKKALPKATKKADPIRLDATLEISPTAIDDLIATCDQELSTLRPIKETLEELEKNLPPKKLSPKPKAIPKASPKTEPIQTEAMRKELETLRNEIRDQSEWTGKLCEKLADFNNRISPGSGTK